VSTVGDRRFVARAGLALACAQARYWFGVAAVVRGQLRRWQTRAAGIPDPLLRSLALNKLKDERFNAEVAAMISTIASPRYRERAVEAIVALQVMYDYLDALTEQPTDDPIRDGLQCSTAFVDAVTVSTQPTTDYYAFYRGGGDAGYLAELVGTVRETLRGLPAAEAIAELIPASTARCAEAQVRIHAAPHSGNEQLEQWAASAAIGSELHWREWLFGAMGSVVAAHALIASAANKRTTPEQANELDRTYLSLCVLTTALDHVVDRERDLLTGEQSYLGLYDSRQELALELTRVARRVSERSHTMPHGPHHAMILSGVVAYYTSQSSALGEFAAPITEGVRDELRPLITPTLATMHVWRLAKRASSAWSAK
jgi:tetraprenyl-beta-curcumene synthase